LEQLNPAAKAATKEKNMKSQNALVIVTVTAIATLFAAQARAQYRAVGDDGIAASPKLRLVLNERARANTLSQADTFVTPVGYRVVAHRDIAASPKVREMLNEQKRNAAVIPSSTAVADVGYRATGADGIAASPKLREQIEGHCSQEFQVAPVK
jgi:hypothetical protein